jgi:hypothetical protein
MFFSKTTGGFYSEDIHGPRKSTVIKPGWVHPLILVPDPAWVATDHPEGTAATMVEIPDPSAVPETVEVDNPDCNIPADAVEITDAEHMALINAQSAGKCIQADASGRPVALDYVKTAADLANEKANALKQMRVLRSEVLNALGGIAGRAQRSGDTATAIACDAASTALLNITADKNVISASDGTSTTLAVLNCYKAAAMALAAVSPSSINAFDALELTL